MAVTQNTYTGNGSTTNYSFTFPYLETTDIKVSVNGVNTTAYTLANATTVSFNTAPANGAAIRIYRDTDDSSLAATFYPGSAIRSQDLNDNFTQNLYTTQEVKARYLDRQSGEMDTAYVPSQALDVVTKGYMETNYGIIDEVGFTRWRQVATASQTVFSGAGSYGNNLSFVPNREQVYLNGVLQQINTDYTTNTAGTTITFGTALTVGDIVDVVCINNLVQNSTTSSDDFSFVQSGTGAVTRSIGSKLRDVVSVKDFGAVGDGVTNDTTAIQAAIDYASQSNKWVYVPAATYNLIPATPIDDEDTSYITYACFIIRSGMSIWAEPGAVFRIANGVSSDAAPKSMGMFCTDSPKSKVRIHNLTMDMNGQNNPISPARPTTYRRYNQSPILVSGKPGGVAAYMDDVHIEGCTFKNNPGTCNIVCAQSNSAGIGLGRRWRIINNQFLDNGLDTDDHTAVFAWAEDVVFSNNVVANSTPIATVGRTGGNTCYEIHGNRHRITNNFFFNYYRGIWVSSNLTDGEAQDSIISNNTFKTVYYGVDFFRTASGLGKASNVVISGNTFRFDSTAAPAPAPTEKVAIQIASAYEQGHVLITGNTATSTDTAVGSIFLGVFAQTVAGQPPSHIVCEGNKVKGFTVLASLHASATTGLSYVSIKNNQLVEPLTTPTLTSGIGVFVRPTSSISTLVIDSNDFIDERSPSKLSYGTYVDPGAVSYFYYNPGGEVGITSSPYYETGLTVNKRDGHWKEITFSPAWSTSGSAITLGNGTLLGRYTIDGNLITVTARLTVGSTTTFPGGTLGFTLPIVSGISGAVYQGNWRIFDSSASIFRFGQVVIDGTASIATLQVDNGTFATSSSPVPLAVGDVVTAQITYRRS